VSRVFSWHWAFLGLLPLLAITVALSAPPLTRLRKAGTVGRPELTAEQRERLPKSARPVPLWAGLMLAAGAAALQVAGQQLSWSALLVGLAGVALLLVGLPRAMPAGFWKFGAGLAALVAV